MESVKKWLSDRTAKKNGRYVHYSPPKLIGVVPAAQLRQWARGGAESRLERAVLAGQGRRLLVEAEALPLSHHLPTLMAKCDALHAAVEKGSLLELQELLEPDYNRRKYVMCCDEAGVGLLHKAVYYNYMDIVEWLVTNFPQLVHQRDSEGRTPLHYAGVCREEAGVAGLLERAGAARGARDAAGRTPAYYRGPARTLLVLPTVVDMPPDPARNPPGLVIKRHNIRIWCHDCDMARLQRVVWEGHGARLLSEVSSQPVVKKFLEAVPYIMNTIKDIHNAVVQNDLEGLMKLSGDPVSPQILSSRDPNNMTVFHKAAGLGHTGILKYIAEKYPQGINDIDNDGRTPLHYAAAVKDDQHTYKTLVSLGADESSVDNKNRTPAYYVSRSQEIDKNSFKTLPEAPRTPSSAYPSSWDWKLLDTEVIAELNKKSRRRNHKASNENISSKTNTNSVSENLDHHAGGMKTSSTRELIKSLPELDDSSKVQNDDEETQKNNLNENSEVMEEKEDEKLELDPETVEEEKEVKAEETADKEEENPIANETDEANTKSEEEKTKENQEDDLEKVLDTQHISDNENHEADIDEDHHNAEISIESHNTETGEPNEIDTNHKNDENKETETGDTTDDDHITEDSAEQTSNDINGTNNEASTQPNSTNTNIYENVEKDADMVKSHEELKQNDKNENISNDLKDAEINDQNEFNEKTPNIDENEKNLDTTSQNGNVKNDEEADPAVEGNKSIGHNEDDDDVHVQGDSHTDHSDITYTNIAETPSSASSAKRGDSEISSGNFKNRRNTQENLIEGVVSSEAEQDSQDASMTERGEHVQGEILVVDSEIDPEVTDLINTANMEMLATLVLNGEGSRLVGRQSNNLELQAFLNNVPMYMQKINKVHIAAREGNISDLQAALDRRKFAIARDPTSPNGATPLHLATVFGKTNIMKYLGGRFPETLSAVDFEGRTALHYAAIIPDNGHYYNLLQQLGANSKDLDDNGRSAEDFFKNPSLLPFSQLLSDFDISEEAAQEMLSDKGASHAANGHMDIPIFQTEEGRYLAQSLGDPLIKGLTEVANVKPKDPVAFLASFLHNFPEHDKPQLGTQESNLIMTQEEAEVENDQPAPIMLPPISETNKLPRSASHTATRQQRPIDVVTIDPQTENSPDAPEAAFSSANRDEHGQSMLHFAAARTHNRNALFQLLQESEVSLGYRDELYRTARDVSIQANVPENTAEIDRWVMQLAARGNTGKIMELLLEGYDHILDIVDDDGVTITEVLAQRGDSEMSDLLASIPAFEASRDSLHGAVRRGDLQAVQDILSAEGGRTVARAQNSFGRTALHVAVLAQHEDIVEYLAQKCPELLRIGDNLERTPLHYAMGVAKIESLSRVLIRAGAKRVLKDLKGRQPSYYFMNKSDILRLREEEEVY